MQAKYLLALNAHEKIGGQTIKKVLAAFDENVENFWKATDHEIKQKLGDKIADLAIESRKLYDPDREIEKLGKLDIGYMTMYDKCYPELLLEIPDHPAVLYIKGNIDSLKKPGIGVVGSRKYSRYGQSVADKLTKQCSESGLTIISGLALGIDAIAHRAALESNGITIGVLGCGLDTIYPISNSNLAREMIEKGGAVISEFPPGTPPLKFNFPARNRIIAGLSLGVLVIEAAEQSGALITAYEALDYNREVFAVPGNIDQENSKGTNILIQKGAKLVLEAEDILNELNIETKNIENKSKEIFPESKDEKIIQEILRAGEESVDNIIEKSKLNIIALNTTLTMMEMKGMVENVGGGRYKLR